MHLKTETIVGAFILGAIAIFLYMNFQLGNLHFDALQHTSYILYSEDAAGLSSKADVKISGVKVGWVDSIELEPSAMVKLTLRILKKYPLHVGMYGLIRQEGLLGAKYIEFVPIQPQGDEIKPGAVLPYAMRKFVSLDDLFFNFQKISEHVERLGETSKEVSSQVTDLIKDFKKNLAKADALLSRLTQFSDKCSENVTGTLESIKDTASTVRETLSLAKEPVAHIGNLAQKLQQGEGSLGKLLTDTQMYEDVKCTAQFARSCVNRVRNCALALDTHVEVLPREHEKTNVKGYFDVWIYPCSDIFCLIGPVYSLRGFARRKFELCDHHCKKFTEEKRDSFALNLQVGARLFCGLQARAGLFQGTAGFGFDWCLPFECVQWVTTFEAFDFKGHTRFDCDDRRPYLKWLNRLYFSDNIYVAFGANDFISKRFRSGFIGLGATFSTCDLWCR